MEEELMFKIVVLILLGSHFVLGPAAVGRNRKPHLITDANGRIDYYYSCIPETWNFLSSSGLMVVMFENSEIPQCAVMKTVVEIDQLSSLSNCGRRNLESTFTGKKIKVTVSPKTCINTNGFTMIYNNSRVTIELKSPTLTKRRVVITLKVFNLPSSISRNCDYGVKNSILRLSWNPPEHSVNEFFSKSGPVSFEVACILNIGGISLENLEDNKVIDVQDDLSHSNFSQILDDEFCKLIGMHKQVSVKHQFVYPVTYHLWMKAITGRSSSKTKTVNYTKQLLLNRDSMTMQFSITLAEQRKLGPGKHAAMVVIENELSQNNESFNLCLLQQLTLKINNIDFIDLDPGVSIVDIYVAGGPATIEVYLRNGRTNQRLKNTTFIIFCSNREECGELLIPMFAPFKGVHYIVAIATNRLGNVSSTFGPVEVLRLVHDVYVMVAPFRINEEPTFIVLYKVALSDGSFELELKTNNMALSFWKGRLPPSSQRFGDLKGFSRLQVPFNPEVYYVYNLTMDVTPYYAFRTGKNTIDARVYSENKKQNVTAKTEVFVLDAMSKICFSGVSMRAGKSFGFLVESFNGHARIILSADVEMSCEISVGHVIQYRWTMYQVQALEEVPDFSQEIHLAETVITDTDEFVIDPRVMESGLYLVKVSAFELNNQGETLLNFDDFASVDVPIGRVQVLICGGTNREFSRNIAEIQFHSCSVHQHLSGRKFYWFCALSETELPTQSDIGFFQRKGSCFGWLPSFVAEGASARIRMEDVKLDTFFIRLFANWNGRDEDHYDQGVTMLPYDGPSIGIECWTNCDKKTSSTESMVLYARCDTCISYKWYSSGGSVGAVLYSEDEFVRVLWLRFGNPSSRVHVTGVDASGRNATAFFERYFGRNPSRKCKLLNERDDVTGATLVTLNCTQKEATFVSFYLDSSSFSSLLQYGYDQRLSGFHLPDRYVTLKAVICSLDGYCISDSHHLKGSSPIDLNVTRMEADLSTAIKSQNTQRVARITTQIRIYGDLSADMKARLLEFALSTKLASLESARMALDILGASLEVERNVIFYKRGAILSKLSDMRDIFIHAPESARFSTASAFNPPFTRVASHVMEAISPPNKIYDQMKASELMQTVSMNLFDHMLPGESLRMLFMPSMMRILGRFRNGQDLEVETNDVAVRVESLRSTNKNPSNMMIFRFQPRIMFGNGLSSPDEVIALSISASQKLPGQAVHNHISVLPATPVKFALKSCLDFPPSSELKMKEIVTPGVVNLNRVWRGNFVFGTKKKESTALKIRMGFRNTTEEMLMKFEKIELHLSGITLLSDRRYYANVTVNGTDFIPDGEYTWTIHNVKGHALYELAGEIYSPQPFTLYVLPYAVRCSAFEDSTHEWTSDRCNAAIGSTTDNWSWCQCDMGVLRTGTGILSPKLLGTKLVAYPNKIDWSFISLNIAEEFRENPIILTVALVTYAIFAVGFLLACMQDKRDMKLPPYIEVVDNMPVETYRYLVSVFTGNVPGAEPTSTVTIGLRGTKAHTIHVLQKHGERILRRGSVITFLMTSLNSLGYIDTVKLWHQNDGSSPDWYIARITVRDFETEGYRFFLANRWLSDSLGDGQVSITLKADNYVRLHDFRTLAAIKAGMYMVDRNIWYSLFVNRSFSVHHMTRVQRVGYLMLLVFMMKLTTLMFFVPYIVSEDLGYYSFEWYDVAAGIASSVCILPATYIVSALFRSCRDRVRKYRRDPRKSSALRPRQTNPPSDDDVASASSYHPRCFKDVPGTSGHRRKNSATGSSRDKPNCES